jgi:acyl-coenzyme A synthetase/AMP-(fatty) acid ligase
VAWLGEEEITFLQTVPSFAREVLKVVLSTGARLPALERLVLMGEALPGELANGLAKALPHVRLSNIYGPTETIAATWAEIDPPVAGTVPIGRPIPGREVILLDDADGPCPTGIPGEIVIRSPYVAAGYGDAEGRYRTGDLGRRRPDGQLEFRGRRDLQVKLYGARIELAEVEAVLAEHESVRECAVVAVSDQDGLVVRLHAYVVPAGEARPQAWRAQLRKRLGLIAVDFQPMTQRLPRNAGGKVDRRRLPEPFLSRGHEPETHLERRLAAIWAELLGHRPVTTDEDFFAAGGHSLLVPQIVQLIRDRFGVDVTVRDCYAHSTLAGMSALIVSNGVSSR